MKFEPTHAASLNADQAAFSCASEHTHQKGLTKREYFAGLAMQGLMSGIDKIMERCQIEAADSLVELIAGMSVEMADTILLQLEKTKK